MCELRKDTIDIYIYKYNKSKKINNNNNRKRSRNNNYSNEKSIFFLYIKKLFFPTSSFFPIVKNDF